MTEALLLHARQDTAEAAQAVRAEAVRAAAGAVPEAEAEAAHTVAEDKNILQ